MLQVKFWGTHGESATLLGMINRDSYAILSDLNKMMHY